jgi:hypothetical protein
VKSIVILPFCEWGLLNATNTQCAGVYLTFAQYIRVSLMDIILIVFMIFTHLTFANL